MTRFNNPREFQKLFIIRKFKEDYVNFINDLMRKLYQPLNQWGKILGDGNYGVINTNYSLEKVTYDHTPEELIPEIKEFYINVYDNIDPKWSLLNYVNSHWTSFMYILNVINYWIETGQLKNQDIFTFKDNYFEELERLKSVLTHTGKYIFFPSQCFYRILGAIETSIYRGNRGENITLQYLSELGEISDVVKSEPSASIDTFGGVDISFKLNGINKTLQCKSFNRWDNRDGKFIFYDISNPARNYRVDYLSFVSNTKKLLFIFDTRNTETQYREKNATFYMDDCLLKTKVNL
jgi:hypothetical protein